MTAIFDWPGFGVSHFELRVQPNLRTFVSPSSGVAQVVDMMGDLWIATTTLVPTTDRREMARREAFFDRLQGGVNAVSLWHLGMTTPLGTLRGYDTVTVYSGGSPIPVYSGVDVIPVYAGGAVLADDVAQLANTCTIQTLPGRVVYAGDMLGIEGQLIRVMADAEADVDGRMLIEFQPRARAAWPMHAAFTTLRPTANFRLRAGQVPTARLAGFADGASIDWIEQL